MDERFITAAAVAERTSVTAETVREWARTGVIPGYQPGGREWLFLWSEVQSAIRAPHQQVAADEPVRRPRRRLAVVGQPEVGMDFRELWKQRQADRAREARS